MAKKSPQKPTSTPTTSTTSTPIASIIVPTYKERDNLTPLTERLFEALPERLQGKVEVIVVDDNSNDGSVAVIEGLWKKYVLRGSGVFAFRV